MFILSVVDGAEVRYNSQDTRYNSQFIRPNYILDVSGELPTILMELDPDDYMRIKNSYIYANSHILTQHDGDFDDNIYFYLHDRLGSVRQIINTSANVKNRSTYNSLDLLGE